MCCTKAVTWRASPQALRQVRKVVDPLRPVGIVGMVVIGAISMFCQRFIGVRDSNADSNALAAVGIDSNASTTVGIPLESAGDFLLFIIRGFVGNYIVSNDSNTTESPLAPTGLCYLPSLGHLIEQVVEGMAIVPLGDGHQLGH